MARRLSGRAGATVRALVLDGHSRAALETVQSLGRARIQVDVSSDDPDCLAFRSRYPRRMLAQPSPVSPPHFIGWLQAHDEEAKYALIVPSTETSLRVLKTLPTDDRLRGKAVLPPSDALEIALDKHRTWELARRLGVPVPDSDLIESLDVAPRPPAYPVILKPVRSQVLVEARTVELSAVVIRSNEERLARLRAMLPRTAVQQQEFVHGRGVGVELLFDHGRKVWHFVHERVHELPLTGGGSTYRRSVVPDPRLLTASETLLSALAWHGVAMVEFRVTPSGQYYLMEINPRLWGSLALAIDCGVNFPLGLLALARGEPADPQPAYRISYYTRDLANDLLWQAANFRADRRDPVILTRPRSISLLEFCRPLVGRESWDHFDRGDLRPTWRILTRVATHWARTLLRTVGHQWLRREVRRRHQRLLRGTHHAEGGRPRLLFLCHGNICRSPFAEAVARTALDGYAISSAGFAEPGRRTPEHIVGIARALGIDMSQAQSTRVTRRHIDEADIILVMDLENYRVVAKEFGDAIDRTTLLGLFAPEPMVAIPDPYSVSDDAARESLRFIRAAIDGLAAWADHRRREIIRDRLVGSGSPGDPTGSSPVAGGRATATRHPPRVC